MKFAKKLQEELYHEWHDKYLDYKSMKKLLKLGSPADMSTFCDLFETQSLKVHWFMQARQALIREGIGPLEKASPLRVLADGGKREDVPVLLEHLNCHCQQLVQDIEHFKGYASLNAVAMRKIIKKFEKRFQVRFIQRFGPLSASSKLDTEHDIGVWLLDPAKHCLRLVRLLLAAPMERQLRQLDFWIQELKAGILFAELRTSSMQSVNPTPVRLQLTGRSEEFKCCIKNTFIDCLQQSSGTPPRAESQPARSVRGGREERPCYEDVDDLTSIPDLRHENLISQAVHIAKPSLGSGSCTSPRCASSAPQSSSISRLVAEDSAELHSGTLPPVQSQGAPPKLMGGGRGTGQRARQTRGAVPMRAQEAPGSPARWWHAVEDICPASGFPVRLLPYPPFKLQQQAAVGTDAHYLVDGPFLVLQILCTWRFECLGRPLTTAEMFALDVHIKRCKLSPFRLGRAFELLSTGTSEAFHELRLMRNRARMRLEHLRHIQKTRLQGGTGPRQSMQQQQPPSPQRGQ